MTRLFPAFADCRFSIQSLNIRGLGCCINKYSIRNDDRAMSVNAFPRPTKLDRTQTWEICRSFLGLCKGKYVVVERDFRDSETTSRNFLETSTRHSSYVHSILCTSESSTGNCPGISPSKKSS